MMTGLLEAAWCAPPSMYMARGSASSSTRSSVRAVLASLTTTWAAFVFSEQGTSTSFARVRRFQDCWSLCALSHRGDLRTRVPSAHQEEDVMVLILIDTNK